jgi:hypothetical protein
MTLPVASAPTLRSNALLALLPSGLRQTLGKMLVGFYLYGFLVSEDFDIESSYSDLSFATSRY